MKRWIALCLALILALSFVACGGEKEPAPVEQTDAPEQVPQQTPDVVGETLETALWTLVYDAETWNYDEEDSYIEENYCEGVLVIPAEEEDLITVTIRVSLDEPYDFRDFLVSYGFDQYEYAVNNSYDLVSVGGVDCLMQEGNYWGYPCLRYFNRVEGAGATVSIEIVGEYEDARVDQLLSGLTIDLTDVGNADGPWYWEGTPFAGTSASAMAGAFTVNSQWLPITDCIMTYETFNHAAVVAGEKAYILCDGVLKQYAFDGSALTYETDIDLGNEFSSIQTTSDGTVWLSGFMCPLVSWKDGTQTGSYQDTDEVSMHPSGAWGISWFSGPECKKLTFSGGAMASEAITFPEVSTISTVVIDENYIYVCGYAADESGHKVYVYDANGALQMTLTDGDGESLGSVTFMAQTANGFLGMDGNMRDVILWAADGTYIGSISDSDLFGTSYPWFCGGTKLADGSILVVMTEERSDRSATELVAFKLSGF